MGVLRTKDLRKIQIEKQVNEIMNSRSYKEKIKEYERDYTIKALLRLLYMSMEYMELNFNCKKNGLKKYMEFMAKRVANMSHDEKYFADADGYYKDTYGISVMDRFGFAIKEEN